MTRKRHAYVQPIGFLSRRGSVSQVPSSYPFPQAARPPFVPGQPMQPYLGGPMPTPNIPTPNPLPTTPGVPDIGGIFQNLLKGGSLDVANMMSNAQKVIGVVNQLGAVVRNMSPMLEMFKGLGDSDTLMETDGLEEYTSVRKRRRRKGKKTKRKYNYSGGTRSKKRKRKN